MKLIDQNELDIVVMLLSIFYNILIIAVFVLRANDLNNLEEKIGPLFDLLIVPFVLLMVFNILNESDTGRLGTMIPIIVYLAYDIWYRQLTKQKPRHHPKKMPKELILYIILFYFGGMAITGYAFIVNNEYGLFVLIFFMLSIIAYFYYQITYNKKKKLIIGN